MPIEWLALLWLVLWRASAAIIKVKKVALGDWLSWLRLWFGLWLWPS